MSKWDMTRRGFLQMAAFGGLAKLVGCGAIDVDLEGNELGEAQGRDNGRGNPGRDAAGKGVVVYRRSGRGRHVSRAARAHNANHLYFDTRAADDPAHPGDKSKIVPVTISKDLFNQLFAKGVKVVDLRLV